MNHDVSKNVPQKVASALRQLESKNLLLLSVDADSYREVQPLVVDFLTTKSKIIYITFTKPFFEIQALLEQKAARHKFYLIDAISKKTKKENMDGDCYCLFDPQSLTELSILLGDLMIIKKYEFIFFDTLSAFLIYNDRETAERFIHHLTGKIPSGMKGIFILLNDQKSMELAKVVTPFFDAHVDLTR